MMRRLRRCGRSTAADALCRREGLAGLAANENGNGSGDEELRRDRCGARPGHGFSAFGGRFTAAPEIGFPIPDSDREARLGRRLGLAGRGSASPELGIEAARREFANDDREAEQVIGFRLKARW